MTSPVPLARWWREPWWARISLALILAVAATLMVWNLARGGDFGFYEASARAMSESWRALLFGAFDPAGTVTLDKLSGFAVPQALSIDLFGMSTSAVALPQVVEGLVTILACAVVGLRWGGRGMGLVAAAAAATTPILVSMFAHPMEDGLLTMALAVALVWWQRAVLTARWWPLAMSAVFIGVGFQAKMLSAWFVLPALVVATLVAGGRGRLRTAGRTLAFGGVTVAASLAWMTVIALTPAGARPFVDGSTDDDVFAMVFGYNGVDRVIADAYPGAVGSHAPVGDSLAQTVSHVFSVVGHTSAASSGGGAEHAADSVTKLFEPPLVTQIGWLYPAALVGLVLGLVRWWPRRADRTPTRPRDRAAFATLVALGVWLATATAFLSVAKVPHTAYVAAIAVQLALLSALAWSEGLRLLRSPRRAVRMFLPALLVVQGAWAALLATESGMPSVLALPAEALLVAGIAVAVVAALRPERGGSSPLARRTRRAVPALVALALVCAPGLFSLQVLDQARDGSGGDAYVGLRPGSGATAETFSPSAPALWGGTAAEWGPVTQLVATARRDGGGRDGSPLFVTDSTVISGQIISATGDSVLTDGGYSQHAPVFTESALRDLVQSGRDRLLVVSTPNAKDDPVAALVRDDRCRQEESWSLTPTEHGEKDGLRGFALYSCS